MSVAQPNLVFILTDDQGFPDLGCNGNPWLETPHIDALHAESLRFADFHAQPLCTPTRGALMSGRRPVRNGAWATCWGRSILRADETTMADVFRAAGYRTGMFGKWHLGDNYPYRPQDRGFDHVVAHKGGGVGQTPDFWGNNYFDDTYFHNGTPRVHRGYCTDVWFDEAMRFIGECPPEVPFFAYIATNAPHTPYLVEERYASRYRNNPNIPEPAFYGMITNIDENVGMLRAYLAEKGLTENTLLVFMTDNGSSGSALVDKHSFVTQGYNAGLRGLKGSFYEGGHRVPLLMHWPGGGLSEGRDITEMCLDIDLLPTFIDWLGLPRPDAAFDGLPLTSLITGAATELPADRVHFLHNRQGTEPPSKWHGAVLTRRWRLVHGRELYDIVADPEQQHDLADQHPEVVHKLTEALTRWWAEVEPGFEERCHLVIGDDADNPTRLDAMDVMGDVAWHQTHIIQAKRSSGSWAVHVAHPGSYRLRLQRWPDELGLPIDEVIESETAARHIYAPRQPWTATIHPTSARVELFGEAYQCHVAPGDRCAQFDIELQQEGDTTLEAWFRNEDGSECGAYYVYVERL